MQTIAIHLEGLGEPRLLEVTDAALAPKIAQMLKGAITMNLAFSTGEIGAGVSYGKELGWCVGMHMQTPFHNDRVVMPLAVAEAVHAALMARESCGCPACKHLTDFRNGFPKVLDMVRAKVESGAGEPTAEDWERAAQANALHGEPAGRA